MVDATLHTDTSVIGRSHFRGSGHVPVLRYSWESSHLHVFLLEFGIIFKILILRNDGHWRFQSPADSREYYISRAHFIEAVFRAGQLCKRESTLIVSGFTHRGSTCNGKMYAKGKGMRRSIIDTCEVTPGNGVDAQRRWDHSKQQVDAM